MSTIATDFFHVLLDKVLNTDGVNHTDTLESRSLQRHTEPWILLSTRRR